MKFHNSKLKISTYVKIIMLVIPLISTNSNHHKMKQNIPQKESIIGEVYNSDELANTLAISYNVARTSKIDEEAISSYSSPQTVSKLQEEVPSPARGPLESAEELPTTGEYYDGNLKLNVVKVNCNLYASQEDCIHNSKCGWCGSRNGCVLGNNFGPLEACVRASFIYGQRYPGTATERRIDERVGGATMTVIHPQPTS